MAKDGGGNPISGANVHFTSSRLDYFDFFVTNNAVTDSNGVATVQLKSRTIGQTTVHANVEGIDLYNTVNVNFVEKTMVDEARRYLDNSSDLSGVYWFYRDNVSDVNSTSTEEGIIYGFGNKDDINMYVNYKMKKNNDKVPKPRKWADYIYKTGLDITEYNGSDPEKKPWRYWAGIDCSGLVQRCANITGYSRIPLLTNQTGSEPYRVDGAINDFYNSYYSDQITTNVGQTPNFNLIQEGDVIGILSGSTYVHWVFVSIKGGNAYNTWVIHAYGGGTDASEWKVIETTLSKIFDDDPTLKFTTFRLKL
jgi:hypothetical protein